MSNVASKDIKKWEEHCAEIQMLGTLDPNDDPVQKARRRERAKKDYRFFFEYYFPHYAKSKCSWFQIRAANKLKKGIKISMLLEWFRSSAKSTHASIGYPLWLKINNELNVFLLVGENETKAKKLLSDVQAELQYNPRFINDFGEQFSYGNWEEGNFVTKDDKAFFSLGMGQSPRGIRHHEHRPDLILVDDVDTKKRCKNPRLVGEAVDWVTEDLMGCFDEDENARQRMIIANNRIAKTSIFSGLVAALINAYHLKVNAVDKNGNPSWPQRHSKQYWITKEANTTYRGYQANYMNNPITVGKIFQASWIQWKKLPKLSQYDSIIAYLDPSYRATGDHKAIKIWGKIGRELHLIKAFVRQCDITEAVKWTYDVDLTWPDDATINYYVEGNFIQDDFINDFDEEGDERGWYVPIIADKRQKPDKFDRIEKISAFYKRGNVYYNEAEKDNADMKKSIEHLLAFEKGSGAPDDSPDADEGAIWLLMKRTRMASFTPVIASRKHTNDY